MMIRAIHNIDEYRASLDQLFDQLDEMRIAIEVNVDSSTNAQSLMAEFDADLKVLYTKVDAESGHLESGEDLACIALLQTNNPAPMPLLDLLLLINQTYKHGYQDGGDGAS